MSIDGPTAFAATVTPDDRAGYRIAIICTGQCSNPASYSETVGDTPLGLFSRDQDNLILSLWSGGSAKLSSRARPEFLTAPDGGIMIRTYEAESGATELHDVNWSVVAGRLVRSAH